MPTRPIRSVLIALSMLGAPVAFCQEDDEVPEEPKLLTCTAQWHLGDSATFEVERHSREWKDGRATKNRAWRYRVQVQVSDSSKHGYTLTWRRLMDTPDVPREMLPGDLLELVDSLEALVINVHTDPRGRLMDIPDLDQLFDRFQATSEKVLRWRMTLPDAPDPEQTEKILQRMQADRQFMQKFLLEDIQVFLVPFGRDLLSAGPYSYEVNTQHAITGGSIPGRTTVELTWPDNDHYHLSMHTVYDPEVAGSSVQEHLDELQGRRAAKRRGAKRSEAPAPMDITQEASYVMDVDRSWPQRMLHVTTAASGDERAEESIRFSSALREAQPASLPELDAQVAADPHSPIPYLLRGARRVDLGLYDEAIEDFTMALSMAPDEATAHAGRGMAHMMRMDMAAAHKDLDRAIVLAPEEGEFWCFRSKVRLRQGRIQEALDDAEQCTALAQHSFQGHVSAAGALLLLYRYPEAVERLDRAVSMAPDDLEVRSLRAQALLELRTEAADSTAAADLRHALQLDPRSTTALATYGNFFLKQGDNDSAVHYFTQLLEVDPGEAVAWHNRGYAHLQAGHLESAVADMQEALDLDPNMAFAYNNMGWAMHLQGEHEQALRSIDRSIAMHPVNAYAHYNRGRVLLSMQRRPEACQAWTTARDLGYRVAFGDAVDLLLDEHCSP